MAPKLADLTVSISILMHRHTNKPLLTSSAAQWTRTCTLGFCSLHFPSGHILIPRFCKMLRHFCFLFTLASFAESACYWRNGTQNPSPDYEPCSTDLSNPLHTVCCAKWDTCLPNGLCQSGFDQDFWRETCTKKNWDEGGCQELCSNEVCTHGKDIFVRQDCHS